MGAWIEISVGVYNLIEALVAPFVGAWIEIGIMSKVGTAVTKSLPSWERGLKLFYSCTICMYTSVAPFVGAWIEIYQRKPL